MLLIKYCVPRISQRYDGKTSQKNGIVMNGKSVQYITNNALGKAIILTNPMANVKDYLPPTINLLF